MQKNSRPPSRLLYLSSSRNYRCRFLLITLFSLLHPLEAAILQDKTAEAYASYVEEVENELISRRNGELPFLNVYESPGNLISLEKDLVVLRNLNEGDQTPKGIIHDWVGAAVLKGITLDQVLQVLTDYDLHQEIFKEVIFSRMTSRSADVVTAHMRFKVDGLLTVVTDSDQVAQVHRISDKKAQIFCHATRINEIENLGEKNEKLLPEGNDRGLLWRINSYVTLEESAEGVTIECRSLHLTRDIPFGIGLFIGSFIKKTPAESLESMLTALKTYFSKDPSLSQEKEPLDSQD